VGQEAAPIKSDARAIRSQTGSWFHPDQPAGRCFSVAGSSTASGINVARRETSLGATAASIIDAPAPDGYRFGGERISTNTQVRAESVETAIWEYVTKIVKNPGILGH
jgi:hypothetical protein